MRSGRVLLGVLVLGSAALSAQPPRFRLYHTDFSRLSPGNFGEPAVKGFPEYHHIPRKFTDGWDIVNNRGPEEWKVFELEGRQVLDYLGYNAEVWTKDFTYPIIVAGDALWGDYSLEAGITPLSRADVADLRGVIFRYQSGRQYYFFGFGPGQTILLRYRDGEKGYNQDGWHELGRKQYPVDPACAYRLRVDAYGSQIVCRIDAETVLSVTDTRFQGGRIGLLACSPVRYHEVTVETSPEELAAFAERKKKLDDEVVGKMKQYPQVEVVLVTGHADRIGTETYNQKLSQRRADAVKAYLVEQGIDAKRVETDAKGESEPVVSCDDVKGKVSGKNRKLVECLQPNRRVMVEVKVQKPVQR